MTTAKVVYYDVWNDIEQIEFKDHLFQFGGMGSGYCYGHQDFDCMDNLTDEEWSDIRNAEEFERGN